MQLSWAEENDVENIDEDFLEILGLFEDEYGNQDEDQNEENWYDFFWSTIDEESEQDEASNNRTSMKDCEDE